MFYKIRKKSSIVLVACIIAFCMQLFSLVRAPFSVVNKPIALLSLIFACLFLYLYDNQKKTTSWIVGSLFAFILYLPRFLTSFYITFIYFPFVFNNNATDAQLAYFPADAVEVLPITKACLLWKPCLLWMQNHFTESLNAFSQGSPLQGEYYSSLSIILFANVLLTVIGGAIAGIFASYIWNRFLSKRISPKWPYMKTKKKSTFVFAISVAAYNISLLTHINKPMVWFVILLICLLLYVYDHWEKPSSLAIGSFFALIMYLPRLIESSYLSFIYIPIIFDNNSEEAKSGALAYIAGGTVEIFPTTKICVLWETCSKWLQDFLLKVFAPISEGLAPQTEYYAFMSLTLLVNFLLIIFGGAIIGMLTSFLWNRFLSKRVTPIVHVIFGSK